MAGVRNAALSMCSAGLLAIRRFDFAQYFMMLGTGPELLVYGHQAKKFEERL